ncbi:MAG: amidohydrolase [Cytophagales bacterium]|nr:MAG: amidohydrolase [Cytophagales bacterium]
MEISKNLSLALVQTHLYWQDPTANRAMLEEKIATISTQPDVIVLPEMFTTGFTMEASNHAEPMHLHTTKWLQQQSAQTNAAIVGSFIVVENQQYYNRLFWVTPDGKIDTYDKRHLFRMAEEHLSYTAGQSKIVKNWRGWRICPLVCYDLRFPVWSRNTMMEYDVLIYVANWPAPRINAWDTLLAARAIENLAYSVGVNRVGTDGKGLEYVGHSAAYSFKGESLCYASQQDTILQVVLERELLEEYRAKFPAYKDADDFLIR